jgi:hypothetical protein
MLFFSYFNHTWVSLTDFFKNTDIFNFIKIHLVGAALFHEDGWSDITNLIVSFCNFVDMFKNSYVEPIGVLIYIIPKAA